MTGGGNQRSSSERAGVVEKVVGAAVLAVRADAAEPEHRRVEAGDAGAGGVGVGCGGG